MLEFVLYEVFFSLVVLIGLDSIGLFENRFKKLMLQCFLVCKCCSCMGIFYYQERFRRRVFIVDEDVGYGMDS